MRLCFRNYSLLIGVVGLAFLAASISNADSPNTKDKTVSVDFERDIKPILQKRCIRCHGEDKREAGVTLTGRRAALTPSDNGKNSIVPGHSSKSELVRRIASDDPDVQMPPKGKRLTDDEVALLKTWIDQGAVWPDDDEARHWAYVKPVRPDLPKVEREEWCNNSIDYFILARLEREGLQPSPRAEKAKLIRRVYLDLIGLPPSPEQVNAFLNDTRPDAYERVVDELLASPRYGERWAVHWLDLARYADSNGFQRDGFRTVWPYRDWVVNAFNADMPFDQFTIEQIAGDLIPAATIEQKIATGFNRCTTVNVEAGVDREEDRVNAIFDRVNTTSTVWLGTTMVCGQCHNHKYDPFSQVDYYRLFAYFNNTPMETAKGDSGANREFTGPKVTLPMPEAVEMERRQVQQQKAQLSKELNKLVAEVSKGQNAWAKEQQADKKALKKLPANIRKLLNAKKLNAKQKQQLNTYYTNLSPQIKKLRLQVLALTKRYNDLTPSTSLVMQEMEKPRPTHVFKRGNFLDKLQEVRPGVPAALHSLPKNAPANRLGLAQWIVDEDNPLTARVTVNRFWSEFFGHGLVETLEDFGAQSEPPTHPKLLDWLATEFVSNGWSVKKLHRLIVTSSTYQQSSKVTPELLQRDPNNKLYARALRIRLPAEMIRDNILAVSGLLSEKMGGEPVFPPQPKGLWNVTGRVDNTYRTSDGEDRFRRGLYTIWRRSSPYPSFIAFDAPERNACVVQRPRTNTPLQALTLLNDPVYIEAAIAFGQRMMTDHPSQSTEGKIRYGFQLAVTRKPNAAEVKILTNLYEKALDRYQKSPKDAAKLLQYATLDNEQQPAQLAAWFQVATVLLNLDETITKN